MLMTAPRTTVTLTIGLTTILTEGEYQRIWSD